MGNMSSDRKRWRRAGRAAIVATAFACLAPARAAAQLDLLGPGAAFASVGGARVSTAELDDWLGARGFPTFGRSAVSIGIGGYRLFGNGVMLGAEAQGFVIGDDEVERGRVGLGAGYATVGVAYAIDVSPRLRVYPRVGLGPGGMALWVESEDTLDFDDVLEDGTPAPQRAPNLARDGLVVDLGAGAELLPRDRSGFTIGVRAGWLTGPFTDRWEMYEHEVRGGPDASLGGPYARVTFGWAWTR